MSTATELIAALKPALAAEGIDLPIYWGIETGILCYLKQCNQMADDGIERGLTNCYCWPGFSCYSGCRQRTKTLKMPGRVSVRVPAN
ncbi:MAG: hypothetical protein R3C11_21640 [Planctomycetaceae bacterium]